MYIYYKIFVKLFEMYWNYRSKFKSSSGEMYSIQHYVIKFVSDLQQVCDFLQYSVFLQQ